MGDACLSTTLEIERSYSSALIYKVTPLTERGKKDGKNYGKVMKQKERMW